MPEAVVSFERRQAELISQGHRVGLTGGRIINEEGSVTVEAPTARGGALLVHKERSPEFDANLRPICTKCRMPRDIVIVIDWPGSDGEAMQFCRSCVDRPSSKPLVVQFRS